MPQTRFSNLQRAFEEILSAGADLNDLSRQWQDGRLFLTEPQEIEARNIAGLLDKLFQESVVEQEVPTLEGTTYTLPA